MKFMKVSWNRTEKYCIMLYDKINKNFKFDCIVAISRGGLIPARIISDLSYIRDIEIYELKVMMFIIKKKLKLHRIFLLILKIRMSCLLMILRIAGIV